MPDPTPAQPVDTPISQAGDLISSGQMVPAGPVPMVDSDGNPWRVAPESVKQELAKGSRIVDPATADHLVALREAGEHPIEAGLEGAARGMVPFAPDVLNALGDPKANQQLRAEANPVAAKVGEVGGNVAGAVGAGLLTGGLGEIGTAADMATQGAIFGAQGASNEINEESLGDHGYNSEAILAHGGLGVVLGAGTSGALGLAKEILPNPITLAGKAVSKASDALSRVVGRGVAALRPELTEQVGKDVVESTAARIAQRAETTPSAAKAIANEDAKSYAEGIDQVYDQNSDLKKNIFGKFLPEQVESLAAEDAAAHQGPTSTFQKSIKGTMEFKSAANEALDDMISQNTASIARNEGPIFDPTMLKQARVALTKFGEEFNEADGLPGLYFASRRARQALDDVMDYAKNIGQGPAVKLAANMLESKIATPLRQMLSNPEVFGPRVVAANDALNATYSKLMRAEDAHFTTLGARDRLEPGRPIQQVKTKASKVLSLFGGFDNLTKEAARDGSQAYLDASQEMVDLAAKMAHDGNQSIDTSQIENLLGSIAKKQSEGIASASMAGGVNGGLGYSVGGFGPELAAGAIGHATGIPFAGTAAAGLTRGIRAVRYPSSSLQILGRIKGLADRHTAEIARGAAGFFTGASKVEAPTIAENAFRSGRDSIAKDQAGEITNLTSNPQLLENTLIRNTSGLSADAPNHAMAVQALVRSRFQIIQGAMPPPPPPSAIKVKPPPSIDQEDHFERMLNLANHPTKTITGGLQDGTMTPDEVAAADQIAPKSMAQLRSRFQAEMIDRPDYDFTLTQKLMLGTLFGHSVSPDTDPDFYAFMQSTFAPAPPAPPAGGPGKPRAAGLDKLTVAQNIATPSQAHQMKETTA